MLCGLRFDLVVWVVVCVLDASRCFGFTDGGVCILGCCGILGSLLFNCCARFWVCACVVDFMFWGGFAA